MTCIVCRLPEPIRDAVDVMIGRGRSVRVVAAAFGLARSTVHRHARHAAPEPDSSRAVADAFLTTTAKLAQQARRDARTTPAASMLDWLIRVLETLPAAWERYEGGRAASLWGGLVDEFHP